MAKRGAGPKSRREVNKVHQDTTHTYRPDNLDYHTGDYTLKKTRGYDSLQSENKENRGRKKADAPRGNTKSSKKGRK